MYRCSLDTDTSGLLLFSKNGDLTQTLLHPNSNTEREYEALVRGEVASVDGLRNQLQSGVNTTEGCFPATLLVVGWFCWFCWFSWFHLSHSNSKKRKQSIM